MTAPRACRTPPPEFNHASLAEVARFEKLEAKHQRGTLSTAERRELIALGLRRTWALLPPELRRPVA